MTKRNSMFKLLTSVALILMLCLGMVMPAFAGLDTNDALVSGTPDLSVNAAITKLLKMPTGTTTPGATFTFTFTPVSVNDVVYDSATPNMPAITAVNVVYASTNAGTTTDGIKSVPIEGTITWPTWPHAGEYVYTVTETAGTYTITDTFAEQMDYSLAEYEIHVYVQEKAGTPGEFYVFALGTYIKVEDDGTATAGTEKVDPTPGGDPLVTGDYSKLVFTNVYTKDNGVEIDDPTDPPDDPAIVTNNTVLAISKTVAGAYGDKTKEFAFSVTVSQPAILATDTQLIYTAYKMEKIAGVDTVVGGPYTFTTTDTAASDTLSVSLTHGQWLAFVDMPVGSSFTVTEAATVDYTATGTLTLNGTATSMTTESDPAVANQALTVPASYLGEAANSAAYTNTYKSVTPTGISVDNLPYIVLIAVALLALVGFVVIKSHKKAKHNA